MFRYNFISETQKGSPTTFFSIVRQKLWQKIVIHTPVFSFITIFDTRNFLKHRSVALRVFLVLWDKPGNKSSDKPPPLLSKKSCSTRNFLKHRSVSARIFSALWNRKLSTDDSEVPLLFVAFFDTRFFLKHRRDALQNFSVMWDKNFDKNCNTPPFSYP